MSKLKQNVSVLFPEMQQENVHVVPHNVPFLMMMMMMMMMK